MTYPRKRRLSVFPSHVLQQSNPPPVKPMQASGIFRKRTDGLSLIGKEPDPGFPAKERAQDKPPMIDPAHASGKSIYDDHECGAGLDGGNERLLARISSGLAHDMNNILTVVIAGSDSLIYSLDDLGPAVPQHILKEFKERLADILDYASIGSHLCRQVLDIARPVQETAVFRLSEAIVHILRFARMSREFREDGGKDLEISSSVEGEPEASGVLSDVVLAGVNILINASKHARNPGKTLRIELKGYSEGDSSCISIRNDGLPIEPEIASKLLKRPVTSGGNGLGLYAASERLRKNGGDLSFESSDERTIFVMKLPRS